MRPAIAGQRRIGNQTVLFPTRPAIISAASVVGPKEGQGPLAQEFDVIKPDTHFGQATWEHAETTMMREAAATAAGKCGLELQSLDLMLAGDLLNQTLASSFAARQIYIPFIGLYGACSTMAESMALASVFVDGGYAQRVLATVSSHHDSAERQYRYPTEFGAQRVPTSQWTVTGAGAAIVAAGGDGPAITAATIGKVVDFGIKDSNDMGSAMAPAAAQTIVQHFQDTGLPANHYDLIVTGDLAEVGNKILVKLLSEAGLNLGNRLDDCGLMIFDRQAQNVKAGGSGCGCSAVVFCGHLMRRLLAGEIERLLLVCTGALLSPTSYQQGDTIPGIAHAVAVEANASGATGAGGGGGGRI
ncbi:MAG: stage V sporulation protein AD [Bacillota bacterium]|nr:stage V sporulation protein AD [Bacillota bacterium]